MKDIEFKAEGQKFKYRVNGIVVNNGRLLVLRMKNEVSYCLPGGHVEFGEDSKNAIIREMKEEINTLVDIDKELAIVENFYIDKNGFETHEISCFYIVTPNNWSEISSIDYIKEENDKGKIKEHNFVWLELDKINNYDLKPVCVKNKLLKQDYNFEHIIIRE